MSKRFGLILFVLLAALFLIVNRGAYAGYFQDDEIDNLSWAPYLSSLDFLKGDKLADCLVADHLRMVERLDNEGAGQRRVDLLVVYEVGASAGSLA